MPPRDMSMLILKVGSKWNHPDGEVISAFSHRREMQVHAQHLCHLDRCGFNRHGLRSMTSLAYDFRLATHQYMLMRIGPNEVLHTDMKTGRQETFGSIPKLVDGKQMHMDVQQWYARRIAHPRHAIFGRPGEFIAFSGKKDYSLATLTLLWDRLTLKTGVTCPRYLAAGRLDYLDSLVLPLAEPLSDRDAADLQGQVLPWRRMVPLNLIRRIEDKRVSVNLHRLGFAASLRELGRRAA